MKIYFMADIIFFRKQQRLMNNVQLEHIREFRILNS